MSLGIELYRLLIQELGIDKNAVLLHLEENVRQRHFDIAIDFLQLGVIRQSFLKETIQTTDNKDPFRSKVGSIFYGDLRK